MQHWPSMSVDEQNFHLESLPWHFYSWSNYQIEGGNWFVCKLSSLFSLHIQTQMKNSFLIGGLVTFTRIECPRLIQSTSFVRSSSTQKRTGIRMPTTFDPKGSHLISPGGWKPVGTIPFVFMINCPCWVCRFSRRKIETLFFVISTKEKVQFILIESQPLLLGYEHLERKRESYHESVAIQYHSTVRIARWKKKTRFSVCLKKNRRTNFIKRNKCLVQKIEHSRTSN